ncbi:unnamed protein product [Miscanthus lutarioriparius]|uniref:Uncharacterized protein n=1 Tax=Miscanthus lutarioriparius TaxID=422564 RepID=A0A811R5C1_9POAL|nr:unnamed protein product [Miscanthus lutarioriparius]
MSHDDPGSSSADIGAGVDALSLDLLTHALAGGRDPRDRKSYRLASRAFARAEAYPTWSPLRTRRWPPSPLPRGSGSSSWTSASEHSKLARSHIQRGDVRDSSEVEQEECGRQGGKTEGAPLHHAPFSLNLTLTKVPTEEVENKDIGIELLSKKCLELRSVDISYLKVASLKFVSVSLMLFRVCESSELQFLVSCFADDDGLQMLSAGNSLKEHYQEQHQQSNNNSNECSNPTNDSSSSNNSNSRKREAEDNEEILPQRNRSRHS